LEKVWRNRWILPNGKELVGSILRPPTSSGLNTNTPLKRRKNEKEVI